MEDYYILTPKGILSYISTPTNENVISYFKKSEFLKYKENNTIGIFSEFDSFKSAEDFAIKNGIDKFIITKIDFDYDEVGVFPTIKTYNILRVFNKTIIVRYDNGFVVDNIEVKRHEVSYYLKMLKKLGYHRCKDASLIYECVNSIL